MEIGYIQVHRLPCVVSVDAGTETGDVQLGRGPRAVSKSETRLSGGKGHRYITINNIV